MADDSIMANIELYENDFYGWIQEQVKCLRSGNFSDLDLEHLIEEVESMGKQERRELINRLIILIGHLLKWQYQPEKRSPSWRATIRVQRQQVRKHIHQNPSLKPFFPEAFEDAYDEGRVLALRETELEESVFPVKPPFSWAFVVQSDELDWLSHE